MGMKVLDPYLQIGVCALLAVTKAQAVEAHAPIDEFEELLYSGHEIWTDSEQESLLSAVVVPLPDLVQNPRIAGTRGRVSKSEYVGYVASVFLGPISHDGETAEYWRVTVRGDPDRWWRFAHEERFSVLERQGSPSWIWLEENVSVEQAEAILQHLWQRLGESETDSRVNSLTKGEIQNIHRFRRTYHSVPDVFYEGMVRHWYEGHHIIEAYAHPVGSTLHYPVAKARFAVVDDGLELISLQRNTGTEWKQLWQTTSRGESRRLAF